MQTNEEPERQNNPKKIVEAILDPSPLTLAHVVMLEKISSPLLYGDSSNTEKNLQSMFLLELPIKDALAKIKGGTVEDDAIVWAADFSADEYRKRLVKWLGSVEAFWAMLPRPDEESKKAESSASVTGG
jgi:hypothetical protein